MSVSEKKAITRADINHLKSNWKSDPCWDIEQTDGFEPFYDELKAFSDLDDINYQLRVKQNKKTSIARNTADIDSFAALKLHQTCKIDNETKVRRVVGGWIYETVALFEDENGAAISTTFVPLANKAALLSAISEYQGDADSETKAIDQDIAELEQKIASAEAWHQEAILASDDLIAKQKQSD